ncbi:SlyX [Marinomonas sp. MED121]|uniref:SlyX family protein n=1 Tax=Marinomonas sp. MED121 TaxID=314277 RepID=UPI0000691100|nr:SlyX family protein [Marinomonas sp. MED121]EAQ67541.1 SlyX [Marinomonas sp. MED121]
MNTTEINERINDLEFKVLYQEDTIESLNQVISQQQKDLLLIQEKMQLLSKIVESYRSQQGINSENEVPPHY